MSNPKGKALPETISVFFVMLVIYGLDVFFLRSDLTILGENFYSRFVSFIIIFMLVFFKKEHITSYGIIKKKGCIKKALALGALFSIVPIVIVSAVEIIFFKFYSPLAIVASFSPPNINYNVGGKIFSVGVCTLIYFFTALFAACFKETFFRGYLLHKFKKLMPFWSANILQAILYSTLMILKLVRNFTYGYYSEQIVSMASAVIVFYIIHEFITGFKWGMLAKVSGATYLPIVDSFVYIFLSNCIHIIDPSIKWMFMLHMLGVQGLSLVIVCIYCLYKSYFTNGLFNNKTTVTEDTPSEPKREVKKERSHSSHHGSHHRSSERHEHHEQQEPVYSSDFIEDKEEISPDQFKEIVDERFTEIKESEKPHNGELSKNEIDDFLKDFGRPQHHYHPPKAQKSKSEKPSDDGSFDVDDFLKDFSNN